MSGITFHCAQTRNKKRVDKDIIIKKTIKNRTYNLEESVKDTKK